MIPYNAKCHMSSKQHRIPIHTQIFEFINHYNHKPYLLMLVKYSIQQFIVVLDTLIPINSSLKNHKVTCHVIFNPLITCTSPFHLITSNLITNISTLFLINKPSATISSKSPIRSNPVSHFPIHLLVSNKLV